MTQLRTSDFDFELPDDRIALRPANPRTSAQMLVSTGAEIHDDTVAGLPKWLRAGDRLVLNDTRVIPARLQGIRTRQDGGQEFKAKVEITLFEPLGDGKWRIMAKPLRKLKADDMIAFDGGLTARCINRSDKHADLEFLINADQLDDAFEQVGQMPLPPYIASKRATDAQDNQDYQTVWAKHRGAVAAPTASLHFDTALLADIRAMGVDITYVTLHVGAGTFLPVTVDDAAHHKMHSEWGEVSDQAAAEIAATRAAGGRVIPVGTTALRVIETAAQGGTIQPWTGDTDIFIYPGFQFNATDGLMTNFHLPKSTLLMLVAALVGKSRLDDIYAHALAQNYRFFSYGDSSLLFRDAQ